MNDENFKIVMSCYDKSITVNRNYPDVKINDVIEDIVICLKGLTFSDSTILDGFKEFINSQQ